MDYDDDEYGFEIDAGGDIIVTDVVSQRINALCALASQVDATDNPKARTILLKAMDRLTDRLIDPRDNVKEV